MLELKLSKLLQNNPLTELFIFSHLVSLKVLEELKTSVKAFQKLKTSVKLKISLSKILKKHENFF